MVFARLEKNRLMLDLSEKELKELELSDKTDFEVIRAKKGVWLLLETQKKIVPRDAGEELKIFSLLKKKELKDRVEGKFETLLSPSQELLLKKLIEEKKVEKFKLNESYKKAVYRIPQLPVKKNFELKEKKSDEYSLEEDGFTIAKTEFAAQKLSSEIGGKIKNGELRGTRSFSGEFFIIDSNLFAQKSKAVLEVLKAKKNVSLVELNSALKLPPTLIKIICTFLTEDGLILERRKEKYVFID